MKIIIKTGDINIEYQDEYSHITEESKKLIIEIMQSLPIQPKPIFIEDFKKNLNSSTLINQNK